MVAEFFNGALVVVRLPGIAQPEVAPLGNGWIYFDSGTNLFMASQNGGAYIPLVGGGGGAPLATVLGLGNTTGANDIVVTGGQAIQGAAELTLASAAGSDLVFTGRGATTNLNQAGETTLDVAYTGVGRTSIIGALNALVDGTVVPSTPALSAVLAVGNTTGANNIVVSAGQKVVSAAASALTLDGATTLDLQAGAATRWQVSAAGHLLPAATDNVEDIGAAGVNRIRTLYAGTSVVVGATITVDGTTNTVSSSADLTLASAAGNDLVLTGRATTTNLNQAGQTALNVAYTGVGRTSLIGALNALVDGAVTPTASALSAVLAVGNTTGANNIVVSAGQKVVSAAASPLLLDGTTTLDFQTGATTRWQVQAAPGHLVPQADNAIDIGVSAVNRIRTLYAGTSVVVGATITVDGTTNTISSSANLTVDTGAAGIMNIGATNAATINVGAGVGVTTILAAADVTISGDLTVNGTTTTVNSTNLTVTDPLIYANNGGLNPSFAGIAWDQGAALDIITVWNPTDSRIEFGRFNTVGGTVLPAGALATLTDIRPANLLLAGDGLSATITSDAAVPLSVNSGDSLTLASSGATAVNISTAGATRWLVNGSGHLLTNAAADNTYDIGAVGASRPRRVYVGTEVVVGSTVTIGTAAVTASGALTVTATGATLGLAATGANAVTVSTAGLVRLTAAADGGLGYAGLAADPAVGGVAEGKLYYNSASQELRLSANGGAYVPLATSASVTLQQAYDNGETIVTTTADGPIEFTGSNANNDNVLEVSKTPGAAQSGVGILVTMNANTTGNGLTVTQAGSGLSALFSGATISCPGAGATSERFGVGATAAGAFATAIGPSSSASATDSVAVGRVASVNATGSGIAIGRTATIGAGATQCVVIGAFATTTTFANTTVVGDGATGAATGVVVVGLNAIASASSGVAVGNSANVNATGSGVAIGASASVGAGATDAVAIGASASANTGVGATAVGRGSSAATTSVAFGRSANSTGGASVAVGDTSTSTGTGSIAIGSASSAALDGSIAMGRSATTTATNQFVVGGNANAISTVIFGEGDTDATPPATVTVRVTDATAASAAAGSAFSLRAGNGDGAGAGGTVTLAGGTSGAGTGGEALIRTGDAALATRVRVMSTGLVGVGSGTPLSTLDVQGSFGHEVVSISASQPADATAVVWLIDASLGAVTLTLPTAASAQRRIYHVKRIDGVIANAVTIDGNGAETIDGSPNQTLIAQYDSIQIVSDGTEWFIL